MTVNRRRGLGPGRHQCFCNEQEESTEQRLPDPGEKSMVADRKAAGLAEGSGRKGWFEGTELVGADGCNNSFSKIGQGYKLLKCRGWVCLHLQ